MTDVQRLATSLNELLDHGPRVKPVESDPNNERRIAAHIGIAINQLMRYGAKYKGMGWIQKPLISLSEASVLVDYYLENGIVDSFTHEQGPLLWRNKTAGVRTRCHLIDIGQNYVWSFETENRRVRWTIPNIQTEDLFRHIKEEFAAEAKRKPEDPPLVVPQPFHLDQLLSPESLQKWAQFLQKRQAKVSRQ